MNKEILVVDDEKEIRELCRDILDAEGFSVEVASDGYEALEKMEKFNFVIYIIDIIMPKIDGLELISKIKKRKPLAVIIVTTGYSSIEGAVRAVHAGAFQYLAKPLSAPELIDTVKKGLEFYNFLYGPLTKTIEPLKEIDKLRGIILFNSFDEKLKDEIYSKGELRTFEKDRNLNLSDIEKSFFIIKKGELSVWYNDKSIDYLTQGDCWGEESILGEDAIFTKLHTELDTEIIVFKIGNLLSLLNENQKRQFLINVTKSIYYKWIRSVQRISMLKTLEANKLLQI